MIPTRNLAIGRQRAGAVNIPAPVGGLNDRDPLAAMPAQDAVILENWWVEPSKLVVRRGYSDFADGFSGPVETLVEYSPPDGSNELFAAAGGSIYDITNGGTFNIPLDVYRTDWEGTQLLYTTPRTNRALRSYVTPTGWNGGASFVLTSDVGTAPDGSNHAGRLGTSVANTPYTFPGSTGSVSYTAGANYVASVWLKIDPSMSNSVVRLRFHANAFGFNKDVNFNVGSGAVSPGTGSAAPLSYGSTVYPNNWVRVWLSDSATSTVNSYPPLVWFGTTINPGEGVDFWGLQVEEGQTPTSYISTNGSAVTITDYTYTPPQTVTTAVAPVTGATMQVRNTMGGLTTFGTGNGSQTIFTLPDVSVFGMADVTGMTSNRWQPAQIGTAGGNFLYLFNGVDAPQLYDGTSWQSVTSGSSPISITGVTTSSLVQGCVFKNRLWMVENASTSVWYLPTSSVGGAATEFDLGSIFTRGGYLVGMYSWTIDAGSGADDHAVFLSSNGEIAVYDGSNPGDAADWRLVGLFYLGVPIGRRCAVKYGGDLLILCERGVLPLGASLLSSAIDRRTAITDKIQNGIAAAIQSNRSGFGWELTIIPQHNAVVLNVPVTIGGNYQYAMNSISGAWTKFTGWGANTFLNASSGLYYGGSNSVKLAWVGNSDGVDAIVADGLPSFQDFGSSAQNKSFTMVRPFIQTDGRPSVLYSINGDYIPQDPTGQLSYTPPGGMVWGSMVWGTMIWGGQITQLSNWNTVGGIYRAAAIRLKVQSNSSNVEWTATSYVYERGGLL